MKKIGARRVTLLCVICILSGIAQAQTDSAAKVNSLINIEQALCDALPGDTLTWSRYLDQHWYAVTEDGSRSDRQAFLNGFSPFSKGISGNIQVKDPVCLFHDRVAVVHYVADEYETVFGQKLHTSYAAMDVWYQTDTSWKMLRMQIFEIPKLPVSVKPINFDVKAIVGTYELADNKMAIVSARQDSLFIQKGKRTPDVLYQEMGNIFFVKSDARGRIIFLKDGTGGMTMIERRNTQNLVWKMKPGKY